MASYATYPAAVAPRAATSTTGLLLLQGAYYLITGIWPLLSVESFQAVTGPKTDHLQSPHPGEADHWLVMTVAILVTAIGLGLVVSAVRRRASAEIVTIALTAALGLTMIDVIYVARDVLKPVYLLDAAAEVLLIIGWLLAALRTSHASLRLGSS
jgi:hypothetical protein